MPLRMARLNCYMIQRFDIFIKYAILSLEYRKGRNSVYYETKRHHTTGHTALFSYCSTDRARYFCGRMDSCSCRDRKYFPYLHKTCRYYQRLQLDDPCHCNRKKCGKYAAFLYEMGIVTVQPRHSQRHLRCFLAALQLTLLISRRSAHSL